MIMRMRRWKRGIITNYCTPHYVAFFRLQSHAWIWYGGGAFAFQDSLFPGFRQIGLEWHLCQDNQLFVCLHMGSFFLFSDHRRWGYKSQKGIITIGYKDFSGWENL
jgi:hypothetical protein